MTFLFSYSFTVCKFTTTTQNFCLLWILLRSIQMTPWAKPGLVGLVLMYVLLENSCNYCEGYAYAIHKCAQWHLIAALVSFWKCVCSHLYSKCLSDWPNYACTVSAYLTG